MAVNHSNFKGAYERGNRGCEWPGGAKGWKSTSNMAYYAYLAPGFAQS